MRWCLLIIGVVMIFFSNSRTQLSNRRLEKLSDVNSWCCYYGDDRAIFNSSYDLYVLESAAIGELSTHDKGGALCLAYLSVGELDVNRAESKEVLNSDFIVESNSVWNGAKVVDVRSKEWQEFIFKCAKHRLLLGYDGLFLDTVDSVEMLLKKDPKHYDGVVESLVQLIKGIRKNNPNCIIMVNGGAEFSKELSPYIDAWCIESVENTYDFTNKIYKKHAPDDLHWVDMRIRKLKATNRPIFALDYSGDKRMKEFILSSLRNRGLIPSVSTIDLMTLP